MEYILNNCILALLDTPGTTLLGIPRMLVDKDYRQKIISNLKDPVIKAFWVHEYEAWQDKFRNEAIAPIQNKVGQFLSTSIIRNVVGQSKSTINIFDMMNDGKIFLVNVSKGRIGEDNSALLGGMIITKIQLAAMERVRIPEETRRDFYLYVDEFQNFVTEAFAGILSEARKYRLNLTVAHQYTAQLEMEKSSAVRDAVFGNVGTMIIFRVGADDAEFLEKEFEPEFTPQDIVNLPNYKVYLKLMIDGVTSRPFSARTLPQMVKGGDKKVEEEVIRSSRELYCRPRPIVEKEIIDWSGMSLGDDTPAVSGPLEKFPAICSNCKKETTVPFKPEKGRPVYCKECMDKIKTGELKVERGSDSAMPFNEEKFFKPLADLGIEFEQKDTGRGAFARTEFTNRHVERGQRAAPTKAMNSAGASGTSPVRPAPPSSMLKQVLSKITSGGTPPPNVAEVKPPVPDPVSLDTLKSKTKDVIAGTTSSKDRAAPPEEMDKLKDLISEKTLPTKVGTPTEVGANPPPVPTPPLPRPDPIPPPPPPTPQTSHLPPPTSQFSPPRAKEVPEDVLKKILE